jgi:nitroreductase
VSTEENKARMRHIPEEIFNTGNLAVADEVIAADYGEHVPYSSAPAAPQAASGGYSMSTLALTTTRAVRCRLDLTRPVPPALISECLAIAQQAPCEGNMQEWHFVVVTDSAKRAALADCYRQGWEVYKTLPISAVNVRFPDPARNAQLARVVASAEYLAAHLHEVPVHVVPCMGFRTEGQPTVVQSAMWGTIAPAAWSFMLAARARGLGTTYTCVHLFAEEQAAHALGIPYPEIMQAALIPVAYYTGDTFKPARREPLTTMVHWETW